MKSENVTIKKEYCPNCFNAIGSMRPCPYCGNEQFDRKNPLALPVNVVLKNRYVVGRMLGAGGLSYSAIQVIMIKFWKSVGIPLVGKLIHILGMLIVNQ